jgi:hypothetical protein
MLTGISCTDTPSTIEALQAERRIERFLPSSSMSLAVVEALSIACNIPSFIPVHIDEA